MTKSESAMPRVSIITSTYNRADKLHRAIASVRAQTLTDWEMCIVGDCTPDHSEDVVASFKDTRLQFYNLPEKSPAGAHGAIAKNHALFNMARAPLIAYLDDDDAYRPRMLETMVEYFDTHPECLIAYCRGGYRDADTGRRIIGNPMQRWMHGYSREKLLRYNYINTNWVVHKRSLSDQLGEWNPKTFFDDYDYWLRASEITDLHYINKVLVDNYIKEDPFLVRAWRKGWNMLKSGGKRMPQPYDGDYGKGAQ